MIVMAIAQVNHLKLASRDNILELPIHLLTDPTAKVDTQILCLRQATSNADPTPVHDSASALKMGSLIDNLLLQYVQPLNPSCSLPSAGTPTVHFKGPFLSTV